MERTAADIIPLMWAGWCLYWWVKARDTKVTVRAESALERASHIVPVIVGALLLMTPTTPFPLFDARLYPWSWTIYWIGAVLVAAGLGFTVWARLTLGRNWSGTVTVKADHQLIREGPYGLVRHPIYTGLLLAFVGSAAARGEWRGVLAVALATYGFWIKLQREEAWMIQTFGPAYEAYRREVRALVPFIL